MESKWIIAILLIGLIALYGFYNNWFAQWGFAPASLQQTGTGVGTGTGSEGIFKVKTVAVNSLDVTSALAIGTDVDITYWAYRNGMWSYLGAYSSEGTEVSLSPQDSNYLYVACAPKSGKAYILDVAKTMSMNSRAVSYQFVDITGDTVKEFVVQFDMRNVPQPASGYPSVTFTAYFFSEDSAGATLNAPADITSIGGTQTIKYIEWYARMSAEKKALAVYKIEVSVNTTLPSKAELVNINVPERGVISASAMTYEQTASGQKWTYTIGNNLANAMVWKLPSNTNNKFDLTTSVRLTLSSGDVLAWTITVYQISAGQTTVVDTDTVITSY